MTVQLFQVPLFPITDPNSALKLVRRLSRLHTFLSRGAGSTPSLLSLQVFLVADRAHAVGAGVTIETASKSAKHWHLRVTGLLSHAPTEVRGGKGDGERIVLKMGVAEVRQND